MCSYIREKSVKNVDKELNLNSASFVIGASSTLVEIQHYLAEVFGVLIMGPNKSQYIHSWHWVDSLDCP